MAPRVIESNLKTLSDSGLSFVCLRADANLQALLFVLLCGKNIDTFVATMTSFNLTVRQRDLLNAVERASFESYCAAMGYAPREHEQMLLRRVQDELRFMIDTVVSTGTMLTPEIERKVRETLDAKSWWEYKAMQKHHHAEEGADSISAIASRLPIDWSYLTDVAKEYGVDPPGSPESLRSFISAVPHLLLYGNEFNAYATRDASLGDIPAVFVFEQLIAAAQGFLDIVMNQVVVLKANGHASVLDEKQWSDVGSTPAFMHECHQVIEMILGHTDMIGQDPAFMLSRSHPEMQLSCRLMFFGASDFVRMHEYAHLLMAHLPQPAHHRREFEADRFGMIVIASKHTEVEGASFWYRLGAIALLVMLMIIETLDQTGPSVSHPPARDRLLSVLPGQRDEQLWLLHHARAILGVCQPTIARHWGVECKI